MYYLKANSFEQIQDMNKSSNYPSNLPSTDYFTQNSFLWHGGDTVKIYPQKLPLQPSQVVFTLIQSYIYRVLSFLLLSIVHFLVQLGCKQIFSFLYWPVPYITSISMYHQHSRNRKGVLKVGTDIHWVN